MRNNKKPFFRFVKGIVRIFKRKPQIIYVGEKINEPCIYISNHSAASGPCTYELYLPSLIRMWGTYEMCKNFKTRWCYLNYIYFGRKKNKSKFLSFILATFLTPFMAMFYKGMQIIPSYPDGRLRDTIKISIEELNRGISILIYPEDSSQGYFDKLTKYYPGFYVLAKSYYAQTKKDIKIVNMYYHKKSNKIIMANPQSYLSIIEKLKTKEEVAEYFLNEANMLYEEYIVKSSKYCNNH